MADIKVVSRRTLSSAICLRRRVLLEPLVEGSASVKGEPGDQAPELTPEGLLELLLLLLLLLVSVSLRCSVALLLPLFVVFVAQLGQT